MSRLSLGFWLLRRCSSLTDEELALFSNSGIEVLGGVCNGGSFRGRVGVTKDGDTISITSNSIPDHATCTGLASGETCYNAPIPDVFIYEQDLSMSIPNSPAVAATKTWVSTGTIGFARNGVSIFSPFSRPCTDAVCDESIGFDVCRGHPAPNGQPYHYHDAPICLDGYAAALETRTPYFIGVMLDGFPLYSKYDSTGEELTNEDLDECHGYDPGDGSGYRYIANDEFPYLTLCYRGTPLEDVQPHCDGQVTPSRRLGESGPPVCADGNAPTCADGSAPDTSTRPPSCGDGSELLCADGSPPPRPEGGRGGGDAPPPGGGGSMTCTAKVPNSGDDLSDANDADAKDGDTRSNGNSTASGLSGLRVDAGVSFAVILGSSLS